MKDETRAEFLARMVEESRHIRECPDCRASLVRLSKPIAKLLRSEVEREIGRALTDAEAQIAARLILVDASMTVAAASLVANLAHDEKFSSFDAQELPYFRRGPPAEA